MDGKESCCIHGNVTPGAEVKTALLCGVRSYSTQIWRIVWALIASIGSRRRCQKSLEILTNMLFEHFRNFIIGLYWTRLSAYRQLP